MFAALMGIIGAYHHIGYPVIARFVYGIQGAKFGIVIRIITGIIWWGVQAYYGAQAVAVMLSCLSPSFASWDTFHDENDITSANLVGLVLYCVFMIPCLFIKPENLHWFFRVVTVFILGTFFGMLGYCVRLGHGVGDLFNEPAAKFSSNGALGWACVQGIFSIVGSAGTGILGQSDFTRYSSTKKGPMYAQIIGAPSALVFACVIGSITTSASNEFLGTVEWNPVVLLAKILAYNNYSSASRAAVFFGSASFVGQQLAINLLLNSLSSSMDMTGLCPKYINIRRGTFIVMIIGILIWPWKILTSAQAVVVFGSGWGCFASAQTGLIILKYFCIYKKKVLLKDLYINGSDSIYWFWRGIDWRSIASFFVGTVFMIPGLVWDTKGETHGGWTYIYKVSYATGIVISMVCQLTLEFVFPAKTIQADTKVDDIYNVDGSRIEELGGSSVELMSVSIADQKGLKFSQV
jgi:NCS1 family nucleobase:cation symporter-1